MRTNVDEQIYRHFNFTIDDTTITTNVNAPLVIVLTVERVVVEKRTERIFRKERQPLVGSNLEH
ncbi:MAG: hypothetical protein AAB831_01780 [Patescibacteria group bacterium]